MAPKASAEWLLCAISTAMIGLCVGWPLAMGWAIGLGLGFLGGKRRPQ